jgi:hypothetical protein
LCNSFFISFLHICEVKVWIIVFFHPSCAELNSVLQKLTPTHSFRM